VKTLANPRDRDELLARLETLRKDSSRRWGVMNVEQMVCHLSDAFLMMRGELRASDATSVLHRTLIKWIALYSPMQWPQGILTRPEVDQMIGGTRPCDFGDDRARVHRLLTRCANEPVDCDGRVHPIFGRLSRSAWMRWAYLHTDHHLRQFGA
jgi:hypothetical protein